MPKKDTWKDTAQRAALGGAIGLGMSGIALVAANQVVGSTILISEYKNSLPPPSKKIIPGAYRALKEVDFETKIADIQSKVDSGEIKLKHQISKTDWNKYLGEYYTHRNANGVSFKGGDYANYEDAASQYDGEVTWRELMRNLSSLKKLKESFTVTYHMTVTLKGMPKEKYNKIQKHINDSGVSLELLAPEEAWDLYLGEIDRATNGELELITKERDKDTWGKIEQKLGILVRAQETHIQAIAGLSSRRARRSRRSANRRKSRQAKRSTRRPKRRLASRSTRRRYKRHKRRLPSRRR